jgi:DNA helicase-2/ATP-dependent DNA helicase PcrA
MHAIYLCNFYSSIMAESFEVMEDAKLTEIILGPPGTGKTTYLLNQMEMELDRGVPPDRIGFVSFTRRAAQEAKDRAILKFGLSSKDLPWIRTLHSLCFRALGLNQSEVLTGKKLTEFGKWAGQPVSGFYSMEEGSTFGFQTGDRCLFMDNLARVKGIPLLDQYEIDRDDLPWSIVEEISLRLVDFKKSQHLSDYTDMLMNFTKLDWSAGLEVLFVDEAQDLSALQWKVVEHLAKGTRRVAIAGDDDQAIYRWAGAAVDHFIDLPGEVTVLDHSWRVPKEIQEVAMNVLSRIEKRRPKDWHPREGEGIINRVPDLDRAELDVNEDTLILGRNTCFLRDDAQRMLEGAGILYEYKGGMSVPKNVVDAIVAWEALRRGDFVTVDQAENIYEHMKAREGYAWGFKKLPAWEDREEQVSMLDLKKGGGLLTDAIWHEALTKITARERQYMIRILQGGQRLTQRSSVRVSTIHGAKGAQADHVILLTDMAWRTFDEAKRFYEDEARTWYVAATRAKKKLTIVDPQANRFRYYSI